VSGSYATTIDGESFESLITDVQGGGQAKTSCYQYVSRVAAAIVSRKATIDREKPRVVPEPRFD
jgi:hypothetical protein